MIKIDYSDFILWDDAGFKLISTKDKKQIIELCYYIKNACEANRRRIWDLNILCLNKRDEDLIDSINKEYFYHI